MKTSPGIKSNLRPEADRRSAPARGRSLDSRIDAGIVRFSSSDGRLSVEDGKAIGTCRSEETASDWGWRSSMADARRGPGGLALADRPRRPDAGRGRRDPVLDRPDGLPADSSLRPAGCRSGTTSGASASRAWPRARWAFSIRPICLLYGLLPTENAYCRALCCTPSGPLGAYWAARRFGASAAGAALGGFAWATCGFFVIHLPHQWGYTVGSWMPWAWGLAWRLRAGRGIAADPLAPGRRAGVASFTGPFSTRLHHRSRRAGPGLWTLVERPNGWRSRLRQSRPVLRGGGGGDPWGFAALTDLGTCPAGSSLARL